MRFARCVLMLLAMASACGLSGCATMISGRDVEVPINSTPTDAHVTVRNDVGEIVAKAQTPARVTLKRGRGLLRKPPHYVATIEKQGYDPQQIAINPKVNPWIAGNIALGGVVGLVADSATGAMWRMTPSKLDYVLTPTSATLASQNNDQAVVQASYLEAGEEE